MSTDYKVVVSMEGGVRTPILWIKMDAPVEERKWAIGRSLDGSVHYTVPVNTKTMVAYKTNGYEWTDEVLEDFVFERWATSMDL